MADEERREKDEQQPGEEGAPEAEAEEQAPEAQAGETPEAPVPEPSEGSPEEPAEEVTAAEEPPAEQPPAEQPPAEEPAAEEPAAEQPPAEEAAEKPSGDAKEKKPDLPPGAELEPIAIESERELSAEERARVEAEAEERARREAEATAETGEEPAPVSAPAVKLEGDARFGATGKRKSSIARVIVLPGSGKIEVNKKSLDEYFPRALHQSMARQPLVTAGYEGNVDVRVRVHGGGIAGQAGAVRHGIARALCEIDPELRRELKKRGFLTRDAREKERRKAGLKKARKRPQFSKR
jgi:small subunit ribosomal protein S9